MFEFGNSLINCQGGSWQLPSGAGAGGGAGSSSESSLGHATLATCHLPLAWQLKFRAVLLFMGQRGTKRFHLIRFIFMRFHLSAASHMALLSSLASAPHPFPFPDTISGAYLRICCKTWQMQSKREGDRERGIAWSLHSAFTTINNDNTYNCRQFIIMVR